jgi:hypothetical protein
MVLAVIHYTMACAQVKVRLAITHRSIDQIVRYPKTVEIAGNPGGKAALGGCFCFGVRDVGRVRPRFLDYTKSVALPWTLGLQQGAMGAVPHELERPRDGALEHLLKLGKSHLPESYSSASKHPITVDF